MRTHIHTQKTTTPNNNNTTHMNWEDFDVSTTLLRWVITDTPSQLENI